METINLEFNTKKHSNIILDTSFQNLVTEWRNTPSGRHVVIVTHPELKEDYATPLQELFKEHNVQTHCREALTRIDLNQQVVPSNTPAAQPERVAHSAQHCSLVAMVAV